ncbi:MAG TPA: hypothetical protein VGN79_01255 [Devosia sp.]|jgi:cellulose synthase/poly-beta-1,6-N-acetylglucosamine synthase-like glycosyltransferase|nr:hypothetical protein [Devosia sp.]
MNANKWIRQSHRWLSISFTLMVLANLAVMGRGDVALWIGALTLVPLFLLLFSGLYLFVLPYLARWRSARRVSS